MNINIGYDDILAYHIFHIRGQTKVAYMKICYEHELTSFISKYDLNQTWRVHILLFTSNKCGIYICIYIKCTELTIVCNISSLLIFVGDVVQVIGSVLDTEDDEEGHLVALHIIHDLMIKSKDTENKWFEYFAKLGVYSKVNVLCEPQEEILDMSSISDTFIDEEEVQGDWLVGRLV